MTTYSHLTDPQTEQIRRRFEVARSSIREAGAVAEDYFRRIKMSTVKSKGLRDLVMEADINTEHIIRSNFEKHFPQDSLFVEESSRSEFRDGRGIWVVNPIDGMQPFVRGIPSWCISIAYVFDGLLEFGLVYNPPCIELFAGGRAFPATVNGGPIAAHTGTDFSTGLVSIGFSLRSTHSFLFDSMAKLLDEKGLFFHNGSGALSLAYVAAGRLTGYVEPNRHAWDYLGAIAIIEAAGGRVSDYLVADSLFSGNLVVAGAPGVFEQLDLLLAKKFPPPDCSGRLPDRHNL